jgi:AcrR family transcriptional regulator
MSSKKPQPVSKVQRRHGAELENAIMDATWQELKTVGYSGLTFDNVAQRAGTSKPVLYRRWPNRLKLVLATMQLHRSQIAGLTPDTGSLRGDILALLESIVQNIEELPIRAVWGILADAMTDTEQGSIAEDLANSNLRAMQTILRRAKERGELRNADYSEMITKLPISLMRHEMIVSGKTVTEEAMVEIVDDIFLPLLSSH